MATTAFLSMWLSNTATAAMMLPIAHAVIKEVHRDNATERRHSQEEEGVCGFTSHQMKQKRRNRRERDGIGLGRGNRGSSSLEPGVEDETTTVRETQFNAEPETEASPSERGGRTVREGTEQRIEGSSENERDGEVDINLVAVRRSRPVTDTDKEREDWTFQEPEGVPEERTFKRLSKVLMLGVAYAANIGGTATLTGTGPNIVLRGNVETWVTRLINIFSFDAAIVTCVLTRRQ